MWSSRIATVASSSATRDVAAQLRLRRRPGAARLALDCPALHPGARKAPPTPSPALPAPTGGVLKACLIFAAARFIRSFACQESLTPPRIDAHVHLQGSETLPVAPPRDVRFHLQAAVSGPEADQQGTVATLPFCIPCRRRITISEVARSASRSTISPSPMISPKRLSSSAAQSAIPRSGNRKTPA